MAEGPFNKIITKLAWAGLVPILFVSTFGIWWSLLLFCYGIFFITGFSLVLIYIAHLNVQLRNSKQNSGNLGLPSRGLESIIHKMQNSRRSYKMDKRLTGSSIIDEPLQEVLRYFFRDYVEGWYYTISTDEEFLYNLRQTLQRALIAFSNRSKDVEWVNFLTRRFVDDVTNHLKIYRKAKQRLDDLANDNEGDDSFLPDLEELFFQVEHEMENDVCRDSICLSENKEKEYLCDVSEMLLYLLLPPEDFHNKPFRYFFRELIATCVLLPSVALISDPDYINQTIAWLCKDSTFTREAFLTIIRVGVDSVDDVDAVKNKVDLEIALLRSRDSEVSGDADASVRQQLSSLLFVKRLCEAKIRQLQYGDGELPQVPTDQHELGKLLVPNQTLPTLLLQDILDNNTALSYFIEFMNEVNSQVYLCFWLTVEGYRVAAEQQLSVTLEKQLVRKHRKSSETTDEELTSSFSSDHGDFESIRTAAVGIYEQYLSEKAEPRVNLPKDLLKSTRKKATCKEPTSTCFDDAQMKVYEILSEERFYGTFLNSQCYIRCLLDLDILKEKSEDGDSISVADEDEVRSLADSELEVNEFQPEAVETPVSQVLWSPDEEVRFNANVTQIGLCKEGGKSYAVYSIAVFRATASGTSSWTIYRRYSDFDDLHLHLKEKFGSMPNLLLPGKRTFRNMDKEFLEKRRVALDAYLQTLLSSELLGQFPGMFEVIATFLEHGKYTREKGQFARKVDTIVAPIRHVSHAIKTVPDGFNKMSGGIQRILAKPGAQRRDLKEESKNLYADIDGEEEDNIPLRILLLLMDEIFDLKDRNLWLRRRIVVILRQIIKTTYGDRINRKIVDTVEWATSAEQIAEYVVMFRNSFWPGGVLAESAPERAADVKTRTRVTAKTKMFGSIPEDLKRFLGTDVTIAGVCRVFDLFQYPSLNKRLIYVLCEGILELLFPDNKFPDIFRKIHAKT